MSLTLANLKAYAVQALGGGDPSVIITSADATKQEIVNQAGRLLFSLNAWHWREREPGSVTLTQSQAYSTLPADFANLVAYGSGTTETTFNITTFDDIAWKRGQSGTPVSGKFWFTVVQPNAGAASAALEVARLEWYPTPGATPPTLNYWYRRKWVDLTSDTDVAKVPTWIELLLVECVRAVAIGSEKGDTNERVTALMSGPIYAAAASEDARLRPDWNRVEVVADGGLKS